jgi:serine/threonine-protein kinase
MSGRRDKAREMLDELDRLSSRSYVRGEARAWIHAGLGDRDALFQWLEQLCNERSPGVLYLKLDPLFAPFRDDPRFDALLRRVGVR